MMGLGKEWIFRIVETQLAVRPGLKTAVHYLDMGETLRKERGPTCHTPDVSKFSQYGRREWVGSVS